MNKQALALGYCLLILSIPIAAWNLLMFVGWVLSPTGNTRGAGQALILFVLSLMVAIAGSELTRRNEQR